MKNKAHSPVSYLPVVSTTASKHLCESPKVIGKASGSPVVKQPPQPNAFIFLTHYHQPDCPRNLSKTSLSSTCHLQSTWILKTYPVPSFEISLMATERILWTGFPKGITDLLYPLLLKIPMHRWGLRAVSVKCLSSAFYPYPSAAQTLVTLLTSSTSLCLGSSAFRWKRINKQEAGEIRIRHPVSAD